MLGLGSGLLLPGLRRRLAAHAAAASCYAILPGNVELQTFETQFSCEILQTGLIDHDGEWLERGESALHCTGPVLEII